MKILLLGPRSNKKDPLAVGGAIVAFETLIVELEKNNIQYNIIDTNKKNYYNTFFAYIFIILQLMNKQRKSTHISLHSSNDYLYLSLIILIIGKLFHKKTSLRKFGGESRSVYENSNQIKKIYLKYIFKNFDLLFFEIKHVVKFFSSLNKKCFWFPNTRTRVIEPILPRSYQKKFVFLGHVTQEKGIDEILEASQYLDDSYTIDIYGPIVDTKYNSDYFDNFNVRYLGILEPDEVLKKLNDYDVLLLPSYKEGYPGIIIESYSLGIPVISTTLENIKELVIPYQTGLLVQPKNSKSLHSAIHEISKSNYSILSQGAYDMFSSFKTSTQCALYIQRLRNE